MSSRSWRTPDRGPLAQTREKFLTREPMEPHHVRGPILASASRFRDVCGGGDACAICLPPRVSGWRLSLAIRLSLRG